MNLVSWYQARVGQKTSGWRARGRALERARVKRRRTGHRHAKGPRESSARSSVLAERGAEGEREADMVAEPTLVLAP